MSKIDRLRTALATWAVVAAVGADAFAQPGGKRIAEGLVVEPISEIGVADLWRLSVPVNIVSKKGKPPGGVVAIWNFNGENAPRDGDWQAVGVIVDGFGDIAEKPVGLRVWAKQGAPIVAAELAPEPGYAVLFSVSIGKMKFALAHTPAGQVLIDGDAIGAIE